MKQLGIPCARNRPVSDVAHTLPNVGSTIQGWFRPLVLIFTNRSVKNMKVTTGKTKARCSGVIQPFTTQQLKLKLEGERKWKWKILYADRSVDLDAGDDFTIKGTPYRVMGKRDWSDHGINVYELVEDYDEQLGEQP